MTTITLAVHGDGALAERLTDETAPAQHETYDTDGTTLLSTVDASDAEINMLIAATPAAVVLLLPLSGSGPPASSTGVNGDLYVDVDTNLTYGPKAGGVWPVGATVALPRA